METFGQTVALIITAVTSFVVGFGAMRAKSKKTISEAQVLTADANARNIDSNATAINSANIVVRTITDQYLAQAKQLKDLEEKYEALAEKFDLLKEQHESEMIVVKQEVEDCRQDREILIRLVQDNDVIIRDEDAARLGIIK